MKRKVKRPFDNEQFRKGYVAGIFAAEKELNTKLLHFAEKAHKIMSEGTFPDYGVKINFKDSHNTIVTNLDMETEEKAKKYDEALEWMRELYPGLHGATKEDAEHYFPELKESEDEIHRKWIIEYLYDGLQKSDEQFKEQFKSAIDWLEKQKEANKAIEAVEKIDKYIDERLANAHDMKDSNPEKKYYRGWDDALGIIAAILQDVYSEEKKKEQNSEDEEYSDFTIYHPLKNGKGNYECIPYSFYGSLTSFSEDKDLIDFLRTCFYTEEECNEWIKQQKEQKPITINQDEKEFLADEITAFLCNYDKEFDGEDPVPSEVAEHFYLLGKQAQEQKPAEWSEEDEEMRKSIVQVLKSFVSQADCESNPSLSASYPTYYKEIDWLESLSPQPKVKWSEEDEKMRNLTIEWAETMSGQLSFVDMVSTDFRKIIAWLKSLCPQSKDEIYKEKNEAFKLGKHQLAIKFMNYLDENRPEGKMYLSNEECEDIEKAFKENDWAKIIQYAKKYLIQSEQKPEAKLTGWVARDREFNSYYGTGLILFREKPRKSYDCWGGNIVAQLPWKLFPDLKWVDEPMKVEVTIRKK